MGKKKVIKQTAEEALKEKEVLESAMSKTAEKSVGGSRHERGRVFINTSYNNTLISITDESGKVIAWSSAGALGFSGPKKATPFAASKVIAALAEKTKKSGPVNIHVLVRGIGGGRDSAIRSLANHGFNILSIKDVTPIPHNGPKPPKVRRV
jgi:small subunit ribosomal protein S11